MTVPLSSHRKGWKAARSKVPWLSERGKERRAAVRKLFHDSRVMEAAIGLNPVYIGGLGARAVLRGSPVHRAWVAARTRWMKENL